MYEIKRVTDPEWDDFFKKSDYKDIHFMKDYLKLLEPYLKGDCYLFMFGNEDKNFLWPFFKRKIKSSLVNSKHTVYFDIISPWYYGGPLTYGEINNEEVKEACLEFNNYCKKEKIVSAFIYFNPYLENHKILNQQVGVEKAGDVVFINLNDSVTNIFNQSFNKACRTAIRRGEKAGIKIHFEKNNECLKSFHKLYIDAMDKKKARDFFKFPLKFFIDLRDFFIDNFLLITVEYNKKIIGGNIFLYKYGIMYNYLGARDLNYPIANPSNRIYFEAVKFGIKKGIKTFDLGGGHPNLLEFKKSFSKLTKPKYILKKIFHEDKYKRLCIEKGMNKYDIKGIDSDFFPEYRNEVKQC